MDRKGNDGNWEAKKTLENIAEKYIYAGFTQCTAMQTAMAFALILPGNISDRRRPGTGPAPRANVKTNLHKQLAYEQEYMTATLTGDYSAFSLSSAIYSKPTLETQEYNIFPRKIMISCRLCSVLVLDKHIMLRDFVNIFLTQIMATKQELNK